MKNKKTIIVGMVFLAMLIVALFGVAVYALKESSESKGLEIANYDPTAIIDGVTFEDKKTEAETLNDKDTTDNETEIGISIIDSKKTTEASSDKEETDEQTTEEDLTTESEETSDEDELDAFESERESYEAYIKELESELSSVKEETNETEEETIESAAQLQSQIAALQESLSILESQSVSADDLILNLNSQVIGVSGQNANLSSSIADLTGQISILQSQLANEQAQKESYSVAASIAEEVATSATERATEPSTSQQIETQPYTQPARDGYNYLAIGNSITIHPTCDYWWNVCGMAASTPEKDYVHLVDDYLNDRFGEVHTSTYNYAPWELQANDRAETFVVVDPYLTSDLDLITIQLGENATNVATFRKDMEELIKHVREKCPNAQIIVIDDFWINEERTPQKKAAAENTGTDFADLSAIRDNPSYMCGMGTTVYDYDGNAHIVDHIGVAVHPGDKGMSYIANAVINLIK